jgi:hypothetical protein
MRILQLLNRQVAIKVMAQRPPSNALSQKAHSSAFLNITAKFNSLAVTMRRPSFLQTDELVLKVLLQRL